MPYAVEMRLGVQVPMRDGVQLSADIYLPKAHGPFPTVLVRTPYYDQRRRYRQCLP